MGRDPVGSLTVIFRLKFHLVMAIGDGLKLATVILRFSEIGMHLKTLIAAATFVTARVLALADQEEPAEPTLKPTLEDAQKFVQAIIADKYKLRAYRNLAKLQGEMDKAERKMIPERSMLWWPRLTASKSSWA
jgi:hypothetical protein